MKEDDCVFFSEASFNLLFRKYFPRLRAYAHRMLQNQNIACDIAQDTFVVIWEKRYEIKQETFENYLFTIVRNKCLTHLKKDLFEQKRIKILQDTRTVEEIYRIDFMNNEPVCLLEKELFDDYSRTLNCLPDKCRQVFKLSREEGMKNREIAEEMDINIKNVERHISKALKLFRDKYKNDMGIVILLLLIIRWL